MMQTTVFSLVVAATMALMPACRDDDDVEDILPDCEVDGLECRNGLTCFSDDNDLQCGYCTTDCSGGAACPIGTGCAFGEICLVECSVAADCPRSYQVCTEGFCASPSDRVVRCD